MQQQDIIQDVLPNGLRLIFLKDQRYTTSAVLFGFSVGWRHDPAGLEGLAHIFEHVVGKRTIKHPEKAAFDATKEMLGIKTEARTYPDYTYYLQYQAHEHLQKSIELMFEAVYGTEFIAADLDKEKAVVLTEAREYMDNDSSFLYYKNRSSLFNGTTLSRFFFGTDESMEKITIDTFKEFYRYYLNPKNAVVIIACNPDADIDQLRRLITAKCADVDTWTDVIIPHLEDELAPLVRDQSIDLRRHQASYLLAFRGRDFTLWNKITFDILRAILAEGFASRLLKRLRDELGLIYSLYVNLLVSKPFFEITIETSTAKESVQTVAEEMKQVVAAAKDVTEADIEKVIEPIRLNVLTGITAAEDATFALTSLLHYNTLVTTEEYLRLLGTVKPGDVRELVDMIIDEQTETIAL